MVRCPTKLPRKKTEEHVALLAVNTVGNNQVRRNKNVLFMLLAGVFAFGFLFLFQEEILSLIKEISPTMEHRDTSGRDILWGEYWAEVLRNPVFGFQLDFLGSPHSMILDGFMMFGLIAGGLVSLLIVLGAGGGVCCLRSHIPNFW